MKKATTSGSLTQSPPPSVDQVALARHLIRDIARPLVHAEGGDQADAEERLAAAIEIVESLRPDDVLETQLIVQMVLSHTVATDVLRRAHRQADPYLASLTLRDAARFMGLYRKQVHTLTHYRGTPKERRRDARLAASLGRSQL